MNKKKEIGILILFMLTFVLYGCTASDQIPLNSTWEYNDCNIYLKFTINENYECQNITFRYIHYNENVTDTVWMTIGADGFRISKLNNCDDNDYAKEGEFIGAGDYLYKDGNDYIEMSFKYRNKNGEYDDFYNFSVKRIN